MWVIIALKPRSTKARSIHAFGRELSSRCINDRQIAFPQNSTGQSVSAPRDVAFFSWFSFHEFWFIPESPDWYQGLHGKTSTSTYPWTLEEHGLDFVFVNFPPSNSFDFVFVVVGHFTKGTHFTPCGEGMNPVKLNTLFIQQFLWLHDLPEKLACGCGPSFASAFWLEVQWSLHVNYALSEAYHPDTDGRTKRTNWTMETYLCHSFSHCQPSMVKVGWI